MKPLKELLKPISFLILVVSLIYSPSINFGFIWDDFTYILNNPSLASGASFWKLWSWGKVNADFWPLTYSSFWIIKYFFQDQAEIYHIINISLFAISVGLLYLLLLRLKVKSALWLALIFAVHPMNVSLVAWVFQLKTNLANVLGLGSLLLFLSYQEDSKKRFLFLSLVVFTLSLLAKINLIFLPVLLLLYLYAKSIDANQLKNKLPSLIPFFAVALFLGSINIYWNNWDVFPDAVSEQIVDPSFFKRSLLATQNYFFYMSRSFFPAPLMFAHPKEAISLSEPGTWIYLFLFLGVLAHSLWSLKQKIYKPVAVGFLITLTLLLPVLGLFEVYYLRYADVAEHWLNLGLVGFFFPLFVQIENIKQKHIAWIMPTALALALAWQTRSYLHEYRSQESVLTASLEKNPKSILAHNVLGSYYKKNDDLEKALKHYRSSVAIQPTAQAYFNIGTIQEKLNLLEQAKESYQKSVELNPFVPIAELNLGVVYLKMNQVELALQTFHSAIKKAPNQSTGYYNIGYTYELLGQKQEALKWYDLALQREPRNPLYLQAFLRVKN